MKAAFTVEGEGFDENEEDKESLLNEFIDYIKVLSSETIQIHHFTTNYS